MSIALTLDELLDREAEAERVQQPPPPKRRRQEKAPPKPAPQPTPDSEPEPEHMCPICQEEVKATSAGLLTCSHIFCYKCIVTWSKQANFCPLCKKRFTRLKRINTLTGKVLSSKRVQRRDFENYPEAEGIDSDDYEDRSDDGENCMVCGAGDNEDVLMLCDNEDCGRCCHTYCCAPPFDKVPDHDWHCADCHDAGRVSEESQALQRRAAEERRLRRQPAPEPVYTPSEQFIRAVAATAGRRAAPDPGWGRYRGRQVAQSMRGDAGRPLYVSAADRADTGRLGMGVTGADGEGTVTGYVRRDRHARQAAVTASVESPVPLPLPPPLPRNPNYVPGQQMAAAAAAPPRRSAKLGSDEGVRAATPATMEQLRELSERSLSDSQMDSDVPAPHRTCTVSARWETAARRDAAEQSVDVDQNAIDERMRSVRRRMSLGRADAALPGWVAKWSKTRQRYFFYDEKDEAAKAVWAKPNGVCVSRHIGGPSDGVTAAAPQRRGRRRREYRQVVAARAALAAAAAAAATASHQVAAEPESALHRRKSQLDPSKVVDGVYIPSQLRNDVLRVAKEHLAPRFRRGDISKDDFKATVAAAVREFLRTAVQRLRPVLQHNPYAYPQLTAGDCDAIRCCCDRAEARVAGA